MQRVKVYRLNNDGLWDDKGTGHVSVEYLEVGIVESLGKNSLRASVIRGLFHRQFNFLIIFSSFYFAWNCSAYRLYSHEVSAARLTGMFGSV